MFREDVLSEETQLLLRKDVFSEKILSILGRDTMEKRKGVSFLGRRH